MLLNNPDFMMSFEKFGALKFDKLTEDSILYVERNNSEDKWKYDLIFNSVIPIITYKQDQHS